MRRFAGLAILVCALQGIVADDTIERLAPPPSGGGELIGVEPLQERAGIGAPNLAVLSIIAVDGSNIPITPQAGKNFWLRITYSHANPNCDFYSIERVVNGWSHLAPEIDWGCGFTGTTFWVHFWGPWMMHEGGTYPITATLDQNDTIAESDETDNSLAINLNVAGSVTAEWDLVDVDAGRSLLGDGTDVIVGTMDDAFDYLHPWFDGLDSQGQPRRVASSQNALGVAGSPVNADHATAVMGIVLADGPNPGDLVGMAPDARYVTAEFINRAGIGGLPVLDVVDAAGFLVDNDVDVINMSWSWWFGSDTDSLTGESSITNLMADYLSWDRNIVCVPAVNQLPDYSSPTAPGSSRNVITVGGLEDNLLQAWSEQDHGPTLDGRLRPDLLGNDAANGVAPWSQWRFGFPVAEGFAGTSFAAPFVTGAVAQMLDYGKQTGGNTDHRAIKAIVMNSGIKALDDDGSPWANDAAQPIDNQQGTGILNMVRIHDMYSAGEQSPADAAVPGYGFGVVSQSVDLGGGAGQVVYDLGQLGTGATRFDATLVWDRHTYWADNNTNNSIDAGDGFFVDPADAQDNLDLRLERDGVEIAASVSLVNNLEHITVVSPFAGEYKLIVERVAVTDSGSDEAFALAWHADGDWSSPGQLASGGVPDGNSNPGPMLLVDKAAGSEITLTWGDSCGANDADYEVYEGAVGSFYSHDSSFCTTGGATTKTLAPAAGDSYYLVVPHNTLREGSYGTDSSGAQRPQGTSACLDQQANACN